MSLKPMPLHTVWRSWLNARFANQITIFAMTLTLVTSLLIGVGSYATLQAHLKAAIAQELAADIALVETRLSQLINLAGAELLTLSRNSLLINSLRDSHGRDVYVLPFLRDFRMAVPGNEDTFLVLYDFKGMPHIEVSLDYAIDAAETVEMVVQVIATGKPQVRFISHDDQTYVTLVQPIHFKPTQSVEGALAVRIQLAPLLAAARVALAQGQVLHFQAADDVVVQTGVSWQNTLRVAQRLKLDAPFDSLGLRLTLDSALNDIHRPLERLTLAYAAGLLLLLPAVGWLAHLGARRLVASLGQLSATAQTIAISGVINVPLQTGGSNEVGRLADAFSQMLARLGTAQAELTHFKNTLDQTLDAIYIFDPESLRFTYVNDGATRQTGYSQIELLQMTPTDLRNTATLAQTMQRLQPLMAGVLTSLTYENVFHHKDGHEIPVEIYLQLIRQEGHAPRFVSRVCDISERKLAQETTMRLNAELEERVLQRTAQLQVANQELEAFSYSVSHDLRSPLNTIDGYSNLLGKEIEASAATERGKHYLARIRFGVAQMGELIDALLALAHVSRTTLRRDSVDLSALAETALNAYRLREPGRAVQLVVQPELVVQGDPGLLRQVLDNLLGNAWKYSSKQPHTHITFKRESNQYGVAVYSVQDHGAGFDMAYSDKLFGVFQRLHTAAEFEGTGIGLATVHKIITRHGGTIWAESAPGQGATFYFTLGA